MPSFVQATVVGIIGERKGLQKIQIVRSDTGVRSGTGVRAGATRENGLQPERAYVLTQLIGPVNVGDVVIINTTAVDLDLGTGGWHFVHWNLSRREWSEKGPGHIMKLRYTSLQADTGAFEESDQYSDPPLLNGLSVVMCLLHSQIAAVAVAAKHIKPNMRIVYVMTDEAALPLVLSDLVSELSEKGLVDATVTCGQAFGGDYEAVNFISALGIAATAAKADLVIACQGPGMVGTGTKHGFGGLEVASMLEEVSIYGGIPFFALRWSEIDERQRHHGLSHHSQTILERTSSHIRVAIPQGFDISEDQLNGHQCQVVGVPDVVNLFEKLGLQVSSMGKSAAQDPSLFLFGAAAGIAGVQES